MRLMIDLEALKLDELYKSIPIWIDRLLLNIENREDIYLLINKGTEEYVHSRYPGFKTVSVGVRNRVFGFYIIFAKMVFRMRLRRIIHKYKIDCFFVPSNYKNNTGCKLPCKRVVAVHDLKYLKVDAGSRKLPDTLKHADGVIAISKYTRQDLMVYYPIIKPEKIKVIYNSVVLPGQSARPQGFKQSGYLLYVNTLHEYKNISTLVKAYKTVLESRDINLIIVAKKTDYWNQKMLPFVKENGMESRITILENISNEELKYVYEHAGLFITTSLYEGFGYTPIEAAICHVPVISSISESLPDVTRGLLNYYYPAMDEDALAEKILTVLSDSPSPERLEEISRIYSEIYSPSVQSGQILDYLKSVVSTENA